MTHGATCVGRWNWLDSLTFEQRDRSAGGLLQCQKNPAKSAANGYAAGVTKLLDQAVEKVHALPAEMQDEAARMLLAYAGDEAP
jgi:hypothetical protein